MDAARIRGLAAERPHGLGELYVGLRDRHGRYRVNARHPVRYRDVGGRALIGLRGDHISIAPATSTMLVERLCTVESDLVRSSIH